jgi:Cytochrome c7 and related cytochrome c
MVKDQSRSPNQGNHRVGFFSLLIKKPLVQIGLGIIGLVLLGGFVIGVRQTQIPPPQPIQFPHDQHVSLGVPCLYCHSGALRGDSAGLPTVALCNGCHQQTKKTDPETDKLASYVKNSESIAWVPVAILPDFVFYSHRPHLAAGINCENCHGEVGQMTAAVPQKMNMGWCLDCHTARSRNNPVMLTKLTDCVTCHK